MQWLPFSLQEQLVQLEIYGGKKSSKGDFYKGYG